MSNSRLVTTSRTSQTETIKTFSATAGTRITGITLDPRTPKEVKLLGFSLNSDQTVVSCRLLVAGPGGSVSYTASMWLEEETRADLNWVNVVDYGAVADNSTDCTAAIAAAIAALPTAAPKGGVVYFPRGFYRVSNIDISGLTNITLAGDGGLAGGSYTGATLIHTGTSGSFIKANASIGTVIKDLTMERTGTFTSADAMIDLSGNAAETNYFKVEHCFIKGATSSGMGININKATDGQISGNHFLGHSTAIQLMPDAGTNYCNGVTIEKNIFHTSSSIHIRGLGGGIRIAGNVFEPRADGSAGAILCSAGQVDINKTAGCVIEGNWMGDVTVSGQYQMTLGGFAIYVQGNVVGGQGINILNNSSGLVIRGNAIYTDNVSGINFGGASITEYDVTCNKFTGTNPITGSLSARTSYAT